MQLYCNSLTQYSRLLTREVMIGDLALGAHNPIRIQTMTTTDTLDTLATVEQSIRCIEAGAELVRITAPSKKEAENLQNIKDELRKRGYSTPLVADIHFTPNAAEIAARIVEKVRVNPGNYVDKKKFEQMEFTDAEYQQEIERIAAKFTPLLKICKEYGTAMRIGTNHGSLSDRIMGRYGDTPMGMVESAMEFLRIARYENYHNIVLSMKASNPLVMVHAYRLLIQQMQQEFGEIYPLHLGVTEAGDGEDGRIKSAAGIGTLLEDGIGDTIRVSLTEDPELELPVCRDIIKRYTSGKIEAEQAARSLPKLDKIPYSPFAYKRRETSAIHNIGGGKVPVVIADLSSYPVIYPDLLRTVGYAYDVETDKWTIGDMAADYVYTGSKVIGFPLPGTLGVIVDPKIYNVATDKESHYPVFSLEEYEKATKKSPLLNFVWIDSMALNTDNAYPSFSFDNTVVPILFTKQEYGLRSIRRLFAHLMHTNVSNPAIVSCHSGWQTTDEHLVHFSTEVGGLLLEGMGDGLMLRVDKSAEIIAPTTGRNYQTIDSREQFLNSTAFGILQACRVRISKTEYISCPSCGRTLFDLQETTSRIRNVTNHLKGVKIAIMGCIVNGPGEMADADFGYVGSGPGKITLYKGKEVVKKNVDSETAVDDLIGLLKESGAWVEK